MRTSPAPAAAAASPVIVWFRSDLRLADNPALHAASAAGQPVIPLYIHDDSTSGGRALGGATRWWLHHSLSALGTALARLGAGQAPAPQLLLWRGRPQEVLVRLSTASGARRILCNRTYDPAIDASDAAVAAALRPRGVMLERFAGALLADPDTVLSAGRGPMRIFTAFWQRLQRIEPTAPLPAPRTLPGFDGALGGDRIEDWELLPRTGWDAQFPARWVPGERGAAARLREFLKTQADDYRGTRDFPALAGTSRLSPHLRFGEISARQVWHAFLAAPAGGPAELTGSGFLRELGWREFAGYTLHHFPTLPERALRREFAAFPWRDDTHALAAWQRGRTGYPLVDAGMRELWQTGWMHNRVRMVVGSFLVKDLLIAWQQGEAWFWDTLVDADRANNALNWQWVSGCGVDAAPYFRIFNPVTQSERFDPEGAYVHAWVPELRALPAPFVHAPWTAPPAVLAQAGVKLGDTYPHPIVVHDEARKRALALFGALRQQR
jgi:deoxyribodipyrimidine photo-lyase